MEWSQTIPCGVFCLEVFPPSVGAQAFSESMGKDRSDLRFSRCSPRNTIRHFKKSI